MSRDVTSAFIEACNAQQTDDGLAVLITIEHPGLPAPIYLNGAGSNVESRGNLFLACPVQVMLSEDSDDRPPQAKLSIDNISREITIALRSIITPPTITIEIVKLSDPETVEMALEDFEMKEVTITTLVIEGTLTMEGLYQEPAIKYYFTPSMFPGLF